MSTNSRPRMVVCAAIKHQCTYDLIVGPRHFDATMACWIERSGMDWHRAEQGFIDQHGEFLSRQEAWKVADAAGQIRRRVGSDGPDGKGLFSENLY